MTNMVKNSQSSQNTEKEKYLIDLKEICFLNTYSINASQTLISIHAHVFNALSSLGWTNAQEMIVKINLTNDKELIEHFKQNFPASEKINNEISKIISRLRINRINNVYLKKLTEEYNNPNSSIKKTVQDEFKKVHLLRFTDKMKHYLDTLVANQFLDSYLSESMIVLFISNKALEKMITLQFPIALQCVQEQRDDIHLEVDKKIEDNLEFSQYLTPTQTTLITQNFCDFLEDWHFKWEIENEKYILNKTIEHHPLPQTKQKL